MMIYGAAFTAFAIAALLIFVWFCLFVYASARKHGFAKGLHESAQLFIGSLVVLALVAIALFGSYWAADRYNLNESERKLLYNAVAVGLIFVGWSVWTAIRIKRRYNRMN